MNEFTARDKDRGLCNTARFRRSPTFAPGYSAK